MNSRKLRLIAVATVFPIVAGLLARSYASHRSAPTIPGKQQDGSYLVTTNQAVTPIGIVQELEGARAKDIALSPDGATLAALTNKQKQGLVLFEAATGRVLNTIPFPKKEPDGLGLVWSPDGKSIYASCQGGVIFKFATDSAIPQPDAGFNVSIAGNDPQILGLQISPDGNTLYTCLGTRNAVALINAHTGAVLQTIPVGNAPYRLLLAPKGDRLYVANRGGKPAEQGEETEPSARTPVRVDRETDAAAGGSISVIDLEHSQTPPEDIPVGKQPSGMAITRDGGKLFVANSDGDSISIVDTVNRKLTGDIPLTRVEDSGFGQMPTGLALSDDEKTIYAACGGENAVAVIPLTGTPKVAGYLPAGWFPIALQLSHGRIYVASSKGIGPRVLNPKNHSYYVHDSIGTVQFIGEQDWHNLAAETHKVAVNNRWRRELPARPGIAPVPVPERVGEPSVFHHVVYIIKENQTYDSLLGDIAKGNGDKTLNLYDESVCPNHHKIANDFVLLDNTYTSGTNSADGHQWCDEAVANGYMEQNYDAHVRSYPYDGGDPLAYSPNGFLWTAALRKHLTVRVYGEFVNHPSIKSLAPGLARNWKNLWNDRQQKSGKFEITAGTDNKALAPYLNPRSIGFPLIVSDQYRADVFLEDLAGFEKSGEMPNLSIMLLPCDHTSGRSAGVPTPAAEVADNDLALGRVVDGISHSRFWNDTLVLVVEDDSQASVDHVDGHRTAAFCASAYTKRGAVISEYYNHTSLLRTIELVLGLPAMTRFDRSATPMNACFTAAANPTPYTLTPNRIPLDTLNMPVTKLKGEAKRLAILSAKQDWSDLDRADPEVVARADWNSRKPGVPFPAQYYSRSMDHDSD